MNSSIAAGSGNYFSGSEWLTKGTTLKAMIMIFSSAVNKKIL
jgi:hypothetical protein